jgi:hypothetical protein
MQDQTLLKEYTEKDDRKDVVRVNVSSVTRPPDVCNLNYCVSFRQTPMLVNVGGCTISRKVRSAVDTG